MFITVDVPFEHLRDRKWREMEIDELQRVFSEAFGDRLDEHKLTVRLSITRHPGTDGEKWLMSMIFVDETGRKSSTVVDASFRCVVDYGEPEAIKWMLGSPADDRRALPNVMMISYEKLERISPRLLSLLISFGDGINLVNTDRHRNPQQIVVG